MPQHLLIGPADAFGAPTQIRERGAGDQVVQVSAGAFQLFMNGSPVGSLAVHGQEVSISELLPGGGAGTFYSSGGQAQSS
jgi:hypothetical protein